MKQIIKHKLKLYLGEIIEVRKTADGEDICPVCGFILGENSGAWRNYQTVLPNGSLAEPGGAPSHDICPCCETHYGFDDDAEGAESITAKWQELRAAWLKRVGPDDPVAKQQLENLRDD